MTLFERDQDALFPSRRPTTDPCECPAEPDATTGDVP